MHLQTLIMLVTSDLRWNESKSGKAYDATAPKGRIIKAIN